MTPNGYVARPPRLRKVPNEDSLQPAPVPAIGGSRSRGGEMRNLNPCGVVVKTT